MSYSILDKCRTCGHQRQHHGFPFCREGHQNRWGKPSRDPGCMVGHSKQTGAVASNEYAVPLSSTTGKCSCEVFEEIKMRMPSTQGNKGMVVCAYEYSDGICGISEAAHARHGVARTGHTFTGAEIVRSMDAEIGDDGVARFVRLIKKGQYFVVPIEVLQAVIHAED